MEPKKEISIPGRPSLERTESHLARFNSARAMFENLGDKEKVQDNVTYRNLTFRSGSLSPIRYSGDFSRSPSPRSPSKPDFSSVSDLTLAKAAEAEKQKSSITNGRPKVASLDTNLDSKHDQELRTISPLNPQLNLTNAIKNSQEEKTSQKQKLPSTAITSDSSAEVSAITKKYTSELFRPKSPNSGEIADQTNIKSLESNKLNNGHSTNKDIVQKHKNWMSHFPKTRTKTDEKVQKSAPASSKPAPSTAPGKENKETPALVLK